MILLKIFFRLFGRWAFVRRIGQGLYTYRKGGKINPAHDFDERHHVSTGGLLLPWMLDTNFSENLDNLGYAGCSPACLRLALSEIDAHEAFTFVDLGAGKGRSLVVASEFPFALIIGIEIATDLFRIAQRNIASLRKAFPDRGRIDLINDDVMSVELRHGYLICFFYHSFARETLRRFLEKLVAGRTEGEVYFIYQNPVYGDVLDAHEGFRRWHAAMLPTDRDDAAPVPRDGTDDVPETIVTWRWSHAHPRAGRPGADASIVPGETHATLSRPSDP